MVSPAFQIALNQMTSGAVITWPRFPFPMADPGLVGRVQLPLLRAHQAHVWAVSLDLPVSARAACESSLSGAELGRASRFHFAVDRHRYINAHGALRQLLGAYLGAPPASLEFGLGTNGKPALAGISKSSGLHFNLTHSEGLALIAVSRDAPVGVDLEQVRTLEDAEDLVARFFSPGEASGYRLVPAGEKAEAFFNLWTRKEAWLKATGEGIACLLDQVEVSFRPGEPARLLSLPQGFPAPSYWSLFDLSPAPGFAAACVLAGSGAEPECWCWEGQLSEE